MTWRGFSAIYLSRTNVRTDTSNVLNGKNGFNLEGETGPCVSVKMTKIIYVWKLMKENI